MPFYQMQSNVFEQKPFVKIALRHSLSLEVFALNVTPPILYIASTSIYLKLYFNSAYAGLNRPFPKHG